MATVSSRFRIKEVGASSRNRTDDYGFANRRLNPLGYTRFSVWDLWLRIYFNLQSQIQNHKLNWRGRRDSNPQSPTWRAGGLTICLRPQNVRGEIWTLNLLSLSQPPLAKLGYAHTENKILAARFELALKSFWNFCLFRLGYASRLKIGGLKGIQTLTRSLQDFYAVAVTSSARK